MSALAPKAEMCGAASNVRFGPIAVMDSTHSISLLARDRSEGGTLAPGGSAKEAASILIDVVHGAPPMHRQRGEIILASAECEAKSLHARIKKLDFKLTIGNWTGLPDQLVQTLFGHRADA